MSMAEYTEGMAPDGVAILKDGHTMLPQDIVSCLNRKSFLEANRIELKECLKSLQYSINLMDQADVFIGNALDQKIVEEMLSRLEEAIVTTFRICCKPGLKEIASTRFHNYALKNCCRSYRSRFVRIIRLLDALLYMDFSKIALATQKVTFPVFKLVFPYCGIWIEAI